MATGKWIAAGSVGLAVVGFMLWAMGAFTPAVPVEETQQQAFERQCRNKIEALVNAEFMGTSDLGVRDEAITNRGTLGYDGVSVQFLDNCSYKVTSFVEAPNGFGVTVRHNYTAVLINDRERNEWRLESFEALPR